MTPSATPSPTPSPSPQPTATPPPLTTPTEQRLLPTNTPGPSGSLGVADGGEFFGEILEEFNLAPDEPDPLDPYGYDVLTPLEYFPQLAPLIGPARWVLRAIATTKHLLSKLTGLDPYYPQPDPVPTRRLDDGP